MTGLTQNNSHSQEAACRSVALFGTFDVENYGDCLFPLIVKHQLGKRLDNLKLYLFSPTNRVPRIADYSKVYAFNEIGEVFNKSPDSFVIGGGALLTTDHALSIYPQIRNLLYPYSLKCWLLPIMIAESWGCPAILNAVGIGPFDKAFNGLAARYLGKVELSLVRDKFTADWLGQLNVSSEIVPDNALLLPDLLSHSEWKSRYDILAQRFNFPEKFIIAQASLLNPALHKKISDSIAETAIYTGLPVVLLPICHHHSDIVSLKIMQRTLISKGVKTCLVNQVLTTIQTSAVLGMSELYIGTSLHGALASIAFGKRVISLSSNKTGKHWGVLSVLGLENCHCRPAQDMVSRAMQLMEMPDNWVRDKAMTAARRVNNYFDRMSDIIKLQRTSLRPNEWSQNRSTGEVMYGVMDGFQQVKQICLSKRQEVNRWKALMQCLVRKNFRTSQYYDQLVFWLRRYKILRYDNRIIPDNRIQENKRTGGVMSNSGESDS